MNTLLDTARERDLADPLREFRDAFWLPQQPGGGAQTYFCGHSLGLQPKRAEIAVLQELRSWREQAVAGHFRSPAPDHPAWLDFGGELARDLALLVGARADEVAVMNSLTVNLHLLMVSFYRPSGARRKILIERFAFPSDRYAVASQIRFHGLDPQECLVELEPEPGSRLVEESRVEDWLQRHGEEVALVLWPGLQYASGQAFDLPRIAAAARKAGARVGFDLAHSVGNLPLDLHDSGCDFAAWCTYKYLNGGPGAVAACFVHSRHAAHFELPAALPRFEGWWGNERASRFRMAAEFTPAVGAEAWQLSTPPILAMAPLRASLRLFREAGLVRLRAKSVQLTGWLAEQIEAEMGDLLEILSPADPARRGCQLSLRIRSGPGHDKDAGLRLHAHLERRGVITDWREPDILRIAPVPLYNSYEDCCAFLQQARAWADREARGAA
ncbi:MAG: kynureninase [Lysobacterales bacterium]